MASVDVVTQENKKAGSLDLASGVFEAPVRTHLLHAEVRRQLAARRRGTHATKNRSAVAGGGRKPWRQKGTGRARQGTIRAPQWAGGGVVFGPVPRGYAHAVPKKMRRAALASALSQKLADGGLVVLDALSFPDGKTRQAAAALAALGLAEARVLVVTADRDASVERATRNLPGVRTLPVGGLNVYDALWASHVVLTRDAVAAVESRLAGPSKEARA